MNEDSDYDTNEQGNVVEIEGFIETRGYEFENPLLLKSMERRFYKLNLFNRTTKIILFSRPETQGQWTEMWCAEHLVCRTRIENNLLIPAAHKGQTRSHVNVSKEKFPQCYATGDKFLAMQYRIEFKGPINLDAFIVIGSLIDNEKNTAQPEKECTTLVYSYRPDYGYSINSKPNELTSDTIISS